MALVDRPTLPERLLEDLDEAQIRAVHADDPALAAAAMLDVVEALPPFSSLVARRSAWLNHVRALIVQLGESCQDELEVRMLAGIARTALAARETTAGLAAAEHALNRATEIGDLPAQVAIRAARLPFLAIGSPVEAARDARLLDAALTLLRADPVPGETPDAAAIRDAEVLVARLAWNGATGDFHKMRADLAALGRLRLPQLEAIAFLAYASQAALAQLYLRSRQRAQAALALIEAARLADAEQAWAELANLQVVIASIAMQAGDFPAAVEHAHSAVDAAAASLIQHAQPDPWLGFPIDISLTDTCAGAVQSLAEAVLQAQDLGDSMGFLVAATAMAAFYLADDRALEALDALTEAAEAARSLGDESVAQSIRDVAEALLGHLGILKS